MRKECCVQDSLETTGLQATQMRWAAMNKSQVVVAFAEQADLLKNERWREYLNYSERV